jgi:hypothetical protein
MKNIILDLDNTIICAIEYTSYNKNKFQPIDNALSSKNMDTSYKVYQRPHLETFLDFIFKHFNVSVFTAASKDYALFIVKNFIINGHPDRKIDFIFHSYHVDLSEHKYNSPKDLRLLWKILPSTFTPENTVIVDDLPDVKKANKQNCINIKAFDVYNEETDKVVPSSVNDNELIHTINVLKLYV